MLPFPQRLDSHEAGSAPTSSPALDSSRSSTATMGTSSPPNTPLSLKDDLEGLNDKVEQLSRRCSKLASLLDEALFKASVLGARLSELELGAARSGGGQRARENARTTVLGLAQETGGAAADSQQLERGNDHGPSLASITNDISTLFNTRISELKSSVATLAKSSLLRVPLVGHLLASLFLPQRRQPPSEDSTAEVHAQSHQNSNDSVENNLPPSFSPPKATLPTELGVGKAPHPYQPVDTEVWDERFKAAEIFEYMAITSMPAYASWSFEELHLAQMSASSCCESQVLPPISSCSSEPLPSPTPLFDFSERTPLVRPFFGTAICPYQPQVVRERAFVDSAWTTYEVESVCITAMPAYSSWSFEELRLADYSERRRHPKHTFLTFSAGPTFAELLQQPPAFDPPNNFSISAPRPRKKLRDPRPTPIHPESREASFGGTFDFRCPISLPPSIPPAEAPTSASLATVPREVERFVVGASPYRPARTSVREGRTDGGRRRRR